MKRDGYFFRTEKGGRKRIFLKKRGYSSYSREKNG